MEMKKNCARSKAMLSGELRFITVFEIIFMLPLLTLP